MTPRISLGQTNPFVGTREEWQRASCGVALVLRLVVWVALLLLLEAAPAHNERALNHCDPSRLTLIWVRRLTNLPQSPTGLCGLPRPCASAGEGCAWGRGAMGQGEARPAGPASPTPAPPLRLPPPGVVAGRNLSRHSRSHRTSARLSPSSPFPTQVLIYFFSGLSSGASLLAPTGITLVPFFDTELKFL